MTELLRYRVRRLFNDRPNPTFRARPWTKIINWGNSHIVQLADGGSQVVINKFDRVAVASNKLITFQTLEGKDGIKIPDFTTDPAIAGGWLRDNQSVVCRTILNGHSGSGIILVTDSGADLPGAPLYVKYIKKQKEFRVHVVFGEVIDVQEKRKRADYEGDTNFQVRNHHTGWVYCRESIVEPAGMREMAVATVREMGLDFGAVDIIWNEKRNESTVLEVNTAPGLEGTTVDKYAEAFVKGLTK